MTFPGAPANNAEIEVRDLGIRTSVRRGTGFTVDTLNVVVVVQAQCHYQVMF